ncbi:MULTISPECIES: hypothetical protein [unclassified Streptomyces]|uniref:hypothetical protein n=1 Tax=unclassified Streptomyces TaxID=2593676 RepID=UPI002252FB29|nr:MULTISPECIES: hypothetical protein [unclassified Streptomyces]MCX5441728.1 hypothetical protein [Streptomyces sp. NBC_00063]WUB92001.1 hypothetical protein OHO83_06480 [Streptomyces sp. NBC_00569]
MLLVGNYSEFHMVASWATISVNYFARHTGRAPQQIIAQYETDIIAAWEDLTWYKCHS